MDTFLAIMLCLLMLGIIFAVIPYLTNAACEFTINLINYLKYK